MSRRFLSSPLGSLSTTTATRSFSISSPGFKSFVVESDLENEHDQPPADQNRQQTSNSPRPPDTTRPLENGLDPGIYKVGLDLLILLSHFGFSYFAAS
jgi:single-strand DNA-binding protein